MYPRMKMLLPVFPVKSVHHGFIGGLLEHTLSVTKLCDYYAANYECINRDLLITAAIFHDIGKIQEIAPFPVNDYTDDGSVCVLDNTI